MSSVLTKDLVELWLLDYAASKYMSSPISAFMRTAASNKWENLSKICCPMLPVRLMTWMTLNLTRNKCQSPTYLQVAVDNVNYLYTFSKGAIPFELYTKVLMSFQLLTLYSMLRRRDKMTLSRLNEYFPRSGFTHENADSQTAAQLTKAVKNFRIHFLPLINDNVARERYLQEQFNVEYGDRFYKKFESLCNQFLGLVAKEAGPTLIDTLLAYDGKSDLKDELSSCKMVAIDILLDQLQENELTEMGIMETFRLIKPTVYGLKVAPIVNQILLDASDDEKEVILIKSTPEDEDSDDKPLETTTEVLHIDRVPADCISDDNLFESDDVKSSPNVKEDILNPSSSDSDVDQNSPVDTSQISGKASQEGHMNQQLYFSPTKLTHKFVVRTMVDAKKDVSPILLRKKTRVQSILSDSDEVGEILSSDKRKRKLPPRDTTRQKPAVIRSKSPPPNRKKTRVQSIFSDSDEEGGRLSSDKRKRKLPPRGTTRAKSPPPNPENDSSDNWSKVVEDVSDEEISFKLNSDEQLNLTGVEANLIQQRSVPKVKLIFKRMIQGENSISYALYS